MNQPALFDPARTTPQPCPVNGCGAIRLPGQQQVPTCQTDLDRATSTDHVRRPKHCLNTIDPAHQHIPY